jgi:hypothetical protein
MSKRRDYGSGAIEPRGANSRRLRYRISGKVFRKTVKGTKTEAQKELRRLLHAGDEGNHVAPDKLTLRQWAEHWLSVRPIGQRTRERYCFVSTSCRRWAIGNCSRSKRQRLMAFMSS